MENGLGEYQTIVVLGGASDIGRAIAARLSTAATTTVVLAGRRPDTIDTSELAGARRSVITAAFDASRPETHTAFVRDLVDRVGDLDVVVVAFGQLGDQAVLDNDPEAAADLIRVNFAGAASAMVAVANQFRSQGHGRMVVLSSVAGERVRRSNFVYGSTKAGLDGFTQGLGDALAGSGASVLVVRPGFVHSKMTEGLKAAPLATTPVAVADATARGLAKGRRTIWVPATLRPMFAVFRHLPGAIWRRLPI